MSNELLWWNPICELINEQRQLTDFGARAIDILFVKEDRGNGKLFKANNGQRKRKILNFVLVVLTKNCRSTVLNCNCKDANGETG